jgi:hypothetical protein
MKKKQNSEPEGTLKEEVLRRRAAVKRIAVGLAGAGIAALPGRPAFPRGNPPAVGSPRVDDMAFDELGRVVLPEGNSLPLDNHRLHVAEETNVLCTTPGCACPPKNSTCPVNLICEDCPKPPPAPLPECYCPPSNSTCTPKGS